MARFDIHGNRNARSEFPLLLDVQADLLADLHTRIVIPLAPSETAGLPMRGLNPSVRIEDRQYILRTELLGSIRTRQLGPVVATLLPERELVVAALDFLFDGV